MINDILSTLPSLESTETEELTEEQLDELDAQAKKDRILFHRERVRNGPANFVHLTNGQVRRANLRAIRRDQKKARRKQIATYFASQREYATLRGTLQAVGVIAPVLRSGKPSERAIENAVLWIVQHYGDVTDSDDVLVKNALQRAYNRFADLTGQDRTEIEFSA